MYSPKPQGNNQYYLKGNQPPPCPLDARVYMSTSLPDKYYNKYKYMAKFVELVRSKTPKVTLFTKQAKCMLMENEPDADLEVCFYDGKFIFCWTYINKLLNMLLI